MGSSLKSGSNLPALTYDLVIGTFNLKKTKLLSSLLAFGLLIVKNTQGYENSEKTKFSDSVSYKTHL